MKAMRSSCGFQFACLLVAFIANMQGAACDSECGESSMGYKCMKQLAPYFKLHWTVGSETSGESGELKGGVTPPVSGEVAFAMEGITDGWVGLGFPARPGYMAPADIIFGWVTQSGEVNVKPYSITINSVTATDENSDIGVSDIAAEEQGGNTTISFKLPIQGGPIELSLVGDTNVNYATGLVDGFPYHRNNRGAGTIALGRGE